MEKKRLIKLLKFLLQILITIITSWGTASGYNATLESDDPTPVTIVADTPALHGYQSFDTPVPGGLPDLHLLVL